MVYVAAENGTFKITGNKLERSLLSFSNNQEVIFYARHEDVYLFGVDNKVYICREDLKIKEVVLEDKAYADASVIVSGKWVNKNLFVLGTLRGGLIFANTSGKTQEIVNYTTGLPDNEIFALVHDKSQGIWAAHEYGFTRLAPYLPLRSFSHYEGLQGNLLCSISFRRSTSHAWPAS